MMCPDLRGQFVVQRDKPKPVIVIPGFLILLGMLSIFEAEENFALHFALSGDGYFSIEVLILCNGFNDWC